MLIANKGPGVTHYRFERLAGNALQKQLNLKMLLHNLKVHELFIVIWLQYCSVYILGGNLHFLYTLEDNV